MGHTARRRRDDGSRPRGRSGRRRAGLRQGRLRGNALRCAREVRDGELEVSSSFSAAHRLCGYGAPCENVHGHNWKVFAVVRCDRLDDVGIGIDFKALRARLREILAGLDHRDLNATPPFDAMNPSAENLARWVFERLAEKLADSPARVARIVVRENDDSGATYMP